MSSSKNESKAQVPARADQVPRELIAAFGGERAVTEGVELRLGQIGIVHPAQMFEMPDGKKAPEFEGIILDIVNVNAWWATPFSESGGGTPPDCFSMDGIRPHPLSDKKQSETCQNCTQNQFGSGTKRGKACKNMKRVHVLMDHGQFPKRLTVPPTSRKSVNEYVTMLLDSGMPYPTVKTHFKLKEARNKDGIKYSELVMERGEIIASNVEEAEPILRKINQFRPVMREQLIEAEEYDSSVD